MYSTVYLMCSRVWVLHLYGVLSIPSALIIHFILWYSYRLLALLQKNAENNKKHVIFKSFLLYIKNLATNYLTYLQTNIIVLYSTHKDSEWREKRLEKLQMYFKMNRNILRRKKKWVIYWPLRSKRSMYNKTSYHVIKIKFTHIE